MLAESMQWPEAMAFCAAMTAMAIVGWAFFKYVMGEK